MDFGIFNLMNRRSRSKTVPRIIRETVEQVQQAETAGFGTSWFTEHHFTNYSITPSPLMMVGHVAPQTLRIKLGTAVVLPALYQPARLIGDILFADNLAGGRLVLGLGSGYQAYELERFGVDLAEASAITDEWVDFLEQSLGRESVEFHGKYIDLPQTWYTIEPVSKPRPEIWIAGNSPGSQTRAMKGGYPLIVTGFGRDTATLAGIRAETDERWRAAGHDPATIRFGTLRYCFITDDKAEAVAYAENARNQIRYSSYLRQGQTMLDAPWLPEQPFEGEMSPAQIAEWNPIGDAETVAEKLVDEIEQVGSNHIALYMSIGDADHEAVMRSIERFGGEVVPMIEKALGPLAGIGQPASAAQ